MINFITHSFNDAQKCLYRMIECLLRLVYIYYNSNKTSVTQSSQRFFAQIIPMRSASKNEERG